MVFTQSRKAAKVKVLVLFTLRLCVFACDSFSTKKFKEPKLLLNLLSFENLVSLTHCKNEDITQKLKLNKQQKFRLKKYSYFCIRE